jgi:hypothetical protein
LLLVIDEIAIQNRNDAVNSMLITTLMESDDNFKNIKQFAGQILLNPKVERRIVGNFTDGKELLKQWRIRVIKHYSV